MKVAIVHDWTTLYSGAERVLEQILHIYPDADLYCLADFVPEDQRHFFQGKTPTTTFVQRLPFARTQFRNYVPLFPLAIEQLDMRPYDLVISSSFAFAKGVITGPDQVHVCYCHSPIRSAWDMEQEYRGSDNRFSWLQSFVAKAAFHYIRMWDVRTANGVDLFMANSSFIARRIEKIYRRDSTVVFPPVDVAKLEVGVDRDDFYLSSGRLTGYKRVDLLVEAFRLTPSRHLKVIGDGPEMHHLRTIAPPNVEFLGFQPFDVLHNHLKQCRAFLFAGIEDFGIAMVEAQACGAPLVCYARGGARDIVRDGVTGVTFDEQTPKGIVNAIEQFERTTTIETPETIRRSTHRFSAEAFRSHFTEVVNDAVANAERLDVNRNGPVLSARYPKPSEFTVHESKYSGQADGSPSSFTF